MTPPALSLSAKSHRTPMSPISYFMEQAIENPTLISLAAGMVDPTSLPAAPVAKAVQDILADPVTARAALQYGTTQGYLPLRERILQHCASLDGVTATEVSLTSADVVITTGSQQLLYMLSEILLDPGDIVITEAPSYFVYHSVLASKGVRVLTVPMDEDGMDVLALAALLQRLEARGELGRVKLVYIVDYFQNPTGRTFAAERRPELLRIIQEFSKQHRIQILEDAAYRELRYEGQDIPSIKRHDRYNQYVIYAGTFSKPCAPGLKTGYALMPHELMEPLVRLKGNHDFGSNNLSQHILNRLLETGAYQEHLEELCGVYRHKRDTMLEALSESFSDLPEVRWTHPRGGMFVWLTLPRQINTGSQGRLLRTAIRAGVLYIPGEFGHVSEEGPVPTNEIRLSFGDAQPEQIREGVRRLRVAFDEVIKQTHGERLVAAGS